MKLSVIICTYNPNPSVFKRCLEAIHEASKQFEPEEIIIVDNNSTTPIGEEDYIKQFVGLNNKVRIVNEIKQGLTPARIKGVYEASGELLLFVDDDNFIKEDYFRRGNEIAFKNPHIGAWSGQVKLIFEKTPDEWTKKYWGLLVYKEFKNDLWSNLPNMPETMPCGAGLFVKKKAADYYVQLHEKGMRNIQLDRNGSSLFSAGDNDLAACACDVGLGVGLFHELLLDHYIPANRITKKYLIKLAEGISTSSIIFRSFRNEFPRKNSLQNKVANLLRLFFKNKVDRDFFRAVLRGEKIGKSILKLY